MRMMFRRLRCLMAISSILTFIFIMAALLRGFSCVHGAQRSHIRKYEDDDAFATPRVPLLPCVSIAYIRFASAPSYRSWRALLLLATADYASSVLMPYAQVDGRRLLGAHHATTNYFIARYRHGSIHIIVIRQIHRASTAAANLALCSAKKMRVGIYRTRRIAALT